MQDAGSRMAGNLSMDWITLYSAYLQQARGTYLVRCRAAKRLKLPYRAFGNLYADHARRNSVSYNQFSATYILNHHYIEEIYYVLY